MRKLDVILILLELIGRSVVDSHGEYLGRLNDIVFDVSSGVVTDLHVEVEANIDVSKYLGKSRKYRSDTY